MKLDDKWVSSVNIHKFILANVHLVLFKAINTSLYDNYFLLKELTVVTRIKSIDIENFYI